jgi:hypothetical protein
MPPLSAAGYRVLCCSRPSVEADAIQHPLTAFDLVPSGLRSRHVDIPRSSLPGVPKSPTQLMVDGRTIPGAHPAGAANQRRNSARKDARSGRFDSTLSIASRLGGAVDRAEIHRQRAGGAHSRLCSICIPLSSARLCDCKISCCPDQCSRWEVRRQGGSRSGGTSGHRCSAAGANAVAGRHSGITD